MATDAINGSSAQAVYDALNPKASAKATEISETQNRFLTLLTAQIRNQDPLNPLDNAQVTSQMAQISTVDGIERLNATLKTLLDSSAGTQTLQAATLVGRSVLVPGSALTLAQGLALGGVELSGPADEAVVTIKDANGLAVRTMNLGDIEAGVHGFAWDGLTDGGAQAAEGSYTVGVSAKQGQNSVTASVLSLGTVGSIARSGMGVSLDLGGLGTFTMNDVKQIF
ncbi:MAG: flagellar hook assembly protein FlgD [Candidatus Nitricoxidivorans perseverans]|uniref:Basal-body rod modification protein FlgD n=1 Tax=Candidatus Nitricoxidivorans perseverans TaxID=2975601 RepID=A0AA49FME8_9PROT|nr:MAG: flagellar hook assembly protein FlgD [Candidatus Nitricoxidivorans perseverans]